MFARHLKRKCLDIARTFAPEDTGNLKWNAIRGMWWTSKNKFRITYDSSVARYIDYLEEGEFAGGSSSKRNKHKDFISRDTVIAINDMLVSYFHLNNRKRYRYSKDKVDLERLERRVKRYSNSVSLYERNNESGE